MNVKLKPDKKLPRLVCLREACDITEDQFRAIRAGETAEVSGETGAILIAGGWCETIEQLDMGGDMEGKDAY